MIWLLLGDQLRRLRVGYLAAGAAMTIVWLSLAAGMLAPEWVVALSLEVIFVIGTAMTGVEYSQKAIRLLPLSNRQLWRARWMLGTVIPAAVMATGRALGVWLASLLIRGSHVRTDLLVIATLCDLAYLGLTSNLLNVISQRRDSVGARVGLVLDGAGAVAYIGGIVWPLVLRPYLPTRWSDFHGVAGAALAIGLALSAAAAFLRRSGGRVLVLPIYRRPAVSSPPRTRRPLPTRTTGAAASLLRVLLGKLLLLLLTLAGIVFVGRLFVHSDPEEFASMWLLVACVTVRGDWRARLRELRILPMATWQLNALLAGTPAVLWVGLWMTVAILHAVFPESVGGSRPAFLAGLIGASALFDACELQVAPGALLLGLLVGSRGLVVLLGTLAAAEIARMPPAELWLSSGAIGAAALSAAVLLNHLALTRSRVIYGPAS